MPNSSSKESDRRYGKRKSSDEEQCKSLSLRLKKKFYFNNLSKFLNHSKIQNQFQIIPILIQEILIKIKKVQWK